MALIVNPRSELIREPNLLIPGKQPIGSVRLNRPAELYGIPRHLNRLGWYGHDETLNTAVGGAYVGVDKDGAYLTHDSEEWQALFSGVKITSTPLTLFGSFYFISGSVPMYFGLEGTWSGWYIGVSGSNLAANTTNSGWPNSGLDIDNMTGKLLNVVARYESDSHRQIIVNGVASVADTTTASESPASSILRLGGDFGGTNSARCRWYNYGVLPYALSETEAIELTRDPYQFSVPA